MGKPSFQLFKEDYNKYCLLFDKWVNEIHSSHFAELIAADNLQQHVGTYAELGDGSNVINCRIERIDYVMGLGSAYSLNPSFLETCSEKDVIKHSSVSVHLILNSDSHTYSCMCDYVDGAISGISYVLPYDSKKQINFIHSVGDKVKVLVGAFNRELVVSNLRKDGNDFICDLSDENGAYIGSFEDSKVKRIDK